jgi:4-hydroxy-tetrahydrodipicolinate reductase
MTSMDRRPKIALVGATGRLGSVIFEMASEPQSQVVLSGTATSRSSSEDLQRLSTADVILDVSVPSGTLSVISALKSSLPPKPYVVGCTGFTPEQFSVVSEYSQRAAVVVCPNFSTGITLLSHILQKYDLLMKGAKLDATIHEVHHRMKRDTPSGTALRLQRALPMSAPSITSTRAGHVVGSHIVSFFGLGEELHFSHQAYDRTAFAKGAIDAAIWVSTQPPGLYGMEHVLGLDR